MSFLTTIPLKNALLELAKQAGAAILKLYAHSETLNVKMKENKTPVTEADLIANDIIREGLQQLTPDIPVISEEMAQVPFTQRKEWSCFWLVDPLDGTKEFLHKTDDFTVNIALIENNQPKIGIIYAPVFDVLYYAFQNQGAFKQIAKNDAFSIHSKPLKYPLTIAVSRRHTGKIAQSIIERIGKCTLLQRGSSIKSCLIAEGLADFYPAFGPMSEWDMAAAQCIIEEAGGAIWDENFYSMRYNTRQNLLTPKLYVVGDKHYDWPEFFRQLSP